MSLYFRYFVTITPWDKAKSSQKKAFCRLTEIGPAVLEKKNLKYRQCILATSLLSPLGKGRDPWFKQTVIRFTQGCFVLSLVEIVQLFWRRWNCGKLTDRRTDKRTPCDQKSSLKVTAHMSLKYIQLFKYRQTEFKCFNKIWSMY